MLKEKRSAERDSRLACGPGFDQKGPVARHGSGPRFCAPVAPEFALAFVEFLRTECASGRFTGRVATLVARAAPDVRGTALMTEVHNDVEGVHGHFRVFLDIDDAIGWLTSKSQ